MSGKSHFTLGCVTAGAIAYLGFQDNSAASVVMALTVPFGSMLPDIDHDRTKLGRERLKIMGYIKKAIIGVFLMYILDALYLTVFKKMSPVSVLMSSIMSVGPLLLSVTVASNPVFKKKTKFFRKHRGIMHTLVPIAGLIIGSYKLKGGFLSMLLTGLSIGYGTHLFADQETTMGNPLLWPLTSKNIPGLPIKAGSKAEIFVLLIDCGVICCLTMFLSRH